MKYKYFQIFFWILALFFTGYAAHADQFPVVIESEVKATLSAERSGVLSQLTVDTGDMVKKGSVVAVVFHDDLIVKKQQRQASKKYRDVQVENLGKLNQKGLVTDEELAKAEMEALINDKEIALTQIEIDRSKIRAPFSGIVVSRKVQPHEWVTPGKEVVEMYDPSRIRIVADIPADIAVSWKPGKVDTLYFSDLKQDVKVKIKVLSPHVDVRSNTIKVYWTVDPGQAKTARLLPGMKGVLKLGEEAQPAGDQQQPGVGQ